MNQNKLRVKDLITLAIFTVIFFAVIMAGSMTFGMVPVLYPFLVSFIALVGGTVWAYMRVKVAKSFSIIIHATVTSLLVSLVGGGWFLALGLFIGGILAEIISSAGHYKDFKLITAGFAAFCLCVHFGAYLLPLTAREYYLDFSLSGGMDEAYMNVFLDFMSWPIMLAGAALCIICAVIGMTIGKAVLKKHFVKAGVV